MPTPMPVGVLWGDWFLCPSLCPGICVSCVCAGGSGSLWEVLHLLTLPFCRGLLLKMHPRSRLVSLLSLASLTAPVPVVPSIPQIQWLFPLLFQVPRALPGWHDLSPTDTTPCHPPPPNAWGRPVLTLTGGSG